MSLLRRKGAVASRALAAAVGGYALAAAATACLAVVLPTSPAEAVLTGTMASFAVYVAAAVWAFAASSGGRAWAGIALPTLACLAVVLVVGEGSGP